MVSHIRVRGEVGATRQGQHRSRSGEEPLQTITSYGMDGSPLRTWHVPLISSMTKFDPKKHHRRSTRLKGYDYSQAGRITSPL